MDLVNWQDAGFTSEDLAILRVTTRGVDYFNAKKQIEHWAQWVRELEIGALWVWDELKAAWASREDVEANLALLSGDTRLRVFTLLDKLDSRFRDKTVATTISGDGRDWWSGRIPAGNRQRRYLFDLDGSE